MFRGPPDRQLKDPEGGEASRGGQSIEGTETAAEIHHVVETCVTDCKDGDGDGKEGVEPVVGWNY